MSEVKNTHPLWRKNATGETSREAAEAVAPSAHTLRLMSLALVEQGPVTSEQAFAAIKDRGVRTVLTSIRPRFTELARQGFVRDSGRRGLGESGKCRSIVWEATDADYRAEFARKQAEASE